MPEVFKQLYPNCRCIIDCSELFIETPVNFDARSKTYSTDWTLEEQIHSTQGAITSSTLETY